MAEIFHICAFTRLDGNYREVLLDLPATDYELLDAMEQLRLKDGEHLSVEFRTVEEYDYLDKRIKEPGLFQLNALARRLAKLDNHDMAAFEGLVCVELQKGAKTIPVPLLTCFAHNGPACHVVEEATTDRELGRFLAESGFVPDVVSLPDAAFELLDFERIGKAHRKAEGGAFTGWGYVERHSKLLPVSQTMDFTPHKPGYIFRVGVTHHPDAEPQYPGRVVYLELPASKEAFDIAEAQLEQFSEIAIREEIW